MYTNVSTDEVAKERCERPPIALDKELDIGMGLKDTQSDVDKYPPTGSDRSKKLPGNLRWIADRAATTQRRASQALLAS